MIKLRMLRWGYYPEFLGKTKMQPDEGGKVTAGTRCFATGFEDEGMVSKPTNASNAELESEKSQETNSPLELPKETHHCQHLGVSLVRCISDFWWPELQEDKFVAMCHSSQRTIPFSLALGSQPPCCVEVQAAGGGCVWRCQLTAPAKHQCQFMNEGDSGDSRPPVGRRQVSLPNPIQILDPQKTRVLVFNYKIFT